MIKFVSIKISEINITNCLTYFLGFIGFGEPSQGMHFLFMDYKFNVSIVNVHLFLSLLKHYLLGLFGGFGLYLI